MTLQELRDAIRIEAEMPGDNTYDYYLDLLIQRELNQQTGLNKYNEAIVLDETIAWVGGNTPYIALPTDLQHLDYDQVRYYRDTEFWFLKRRPARWATSIGDAIYFQRTNSGTTQQLYFTPNADVNYATDSIVINYWRKLTWNVDGDECPIPQLTPVIQHAVAKRVAKLQSTNNFERSAIAQREAYIAARATSQDN